MAAPSDFPSNSNTSLGLQKSWRRSRQISYIKTNWRWEEQTLHIVYHYDLADVAHFNHALSFSFAQSGLAPGTTLDLTSFFYTLGLVELISYWKCACPKLVALHEFSLSIEQQSWWQKLWHLGLGEFRFLNKIETLEQDFVHFCNPSPAPLIFSPLPTSPQNYFIIPIGGGKDSALTLEILKNQPGTALLVQTNQNTNIAARTCAEIAGRPLILVQRTFDPKLAALNQAGYLNGHVPFSATLAAISLICAALTHTPYIALSNESSANEASVEGTKINHQYSKSLEFERDFQAYTHRWLDRNINYFSLLRPLNEVQIASLFSHLPAYHPHFRSCNVGSGQNRWCANCAKCLFTYILFAPFVPRQTLRDWFGAHLLDTPELAPTLLELIGAAAHKPFECVGTTEEVRACLNSLGIIEPAYSQDTLFKTALPHLKTARLTPALDQLLCQAPAPHAMPDEVFKNILLPYLKEHLYAKASHRVKAKSLA